MTMRSKRPSPLVHTLRVAAVTALLTQSTTIIPTALAFTSRTNLNLNQRSPATNLNHKASFFGRTRRQRLHVSSTVHEEDALEAAANGLILDPTACIASPQPLIQEQGRVVVSEPEQSSSSSALWTKLSEKIGTVDDDRLLFPEYDSGQVPRMFSSLEYSSTEQGTFTATHAAGSVLTAAAMVAGTTLGAGALALPHATVAAGFLPSSAAMIVAWIYMSMSGLLISELALNRMAETGRPTTNLLELYTDGSNLDNNNNNNNNKGWNSTVGSVAYFFLHYALLVAFLAQGGVNLEQGIMSLSSVGAALPTGTGQVTVAALVGAGVYVTSPAVAQKINTGLVVGVAATLMGIIAVGAGSADFGALVDLSNQHAEKVADCFPIIFLSLVYQNVVPKVVSQLEGDRTKITQAIVAGTSVPLLLFLAWNAIVLGNVMGADDLVTTASQMDPLAALQSGSIGNVALGPLVNVFSSLALVTSLVGFSNGLMDAWTNVFGISTQSAEYQQQWKAPLLGLVFLPPLALAVANPDIFYQALEFGGAFGVSTLFLVLPPLLVWHERYGEEKKPLMTKPMVPFGKITLGSMYKAAGTLILEQGAEKLGVFDFFQNLQ